MCVFLQCGSRVVVVIQSGYQHVAVSEESSTHTGHHQHLPSLQLLHQQLCGQDEVGSTSLLSWSLTRFKLCQDSLVLSIHVVFSQLNDAICMVFACICILLPVPPK